jgi:hypothetical protein
VHDRKCAQARQHEVARRRDSTGDPQPGGAWCEAELDEEPGSGGKIADEHVRAELPDCAHPGDDLGERVVGADEERLHPAREREVGPASHDGVRDLQVDEHADRGQEVVVCIVGPAGIDEKDAWGNSARKGGAPGDTDVQCRPLDSAAEARWLPRLHGFLFKRMPGGEGSETTRLKLHVCVLVLGTTTASYERTMAGVVTAFEGERKANCWPLLLGV